MVEGKTHFVRAPKSKELEKVLRNGVREIYMSKSAKERLSTKSKKMIKSAGATVIVESVRGRPLELSPQQISQVVELQKDHRTFREIENIMGVSKSTAHYLIKYAERQKMKQGKKVIYL